MGEPTNSNTVEELHAHVRRWYALLPLGDAAEMGELYTADAKLFLAGLAGVSGRTAIAKFLSSIPTYVDVTARHRIDDVTLLSDGLAIVTGASWVDTRTRHTDERATEAARFLMVMQREDGVWRCAYDMSQQTPDIR
jgi:uncharacterized protein (TIGR02246 family)